MNTSHAGTVGAPGIEGLWRLAAWVFLTALVLQGMPIGRELEPSAMAAALSNEVSALRGVASVSLERKIMGVMVWGALYTLAGWVILSKRPRSWLHAMRRSWPLALLLGLVPLGLLWSESPAPLVMNLAHACGVTLVAFAASFAYWDRAPILARQVGLATGVNVGAHLLAVLLVPHVAVWDDGRWMGLSGNPNTLGQLAALALWAAGVGWLAGGLRLVYAVPIALIGATGLWGSGSVTPVVALAAGGLAAWGAWAGLSPARYGRLALVMGAALVGLLWRPLFLFTSEHLAPALGRGADLTGRVALWQEGWRLFKERPLLGWGFDDYATLAEHGWLPATHFHNGWLDLALRGGGVGVSLFAVWLWTGLGRALAAGRAFRVVFLSFLGFFLVYNLTETSIAQFRNATWLLLVTLILMGLPRKNGLVR